MLPNEVLVVDIEATCWETREEQGDRPNEIIEIGCAKLNLKTGVISDVASYLVKPKFTKVSPFCTQLTGWTQEDIDQGGSILVQLLAIQQDYSLQDTDCWFSCGRYDRNKLDLYARGSVGQLYGIKREENVFVRMEHFNIKTLFGLKRREKARGMDGMLKAIGEKLEGRHHNGGDDAANIAKIVRWVLK